MASPRNITFISDYYYHIFNRGIDRRITFTDKREFSRAKNLLFFYQFADVPVRFSRFNRLPQDQQNTTLDTMQASGKIVEIISYCLMPNHFHLLLRQTKDRGITTFVSNFVNAYTKYFNTKHERLGALYQGLFKAVYVESDEQLLHLTRYIHLNPVIASIIPKEKLAEYQWSSYATYISGTPDKLIDPNNILSSFSSPEDYKRFVHDQISYAKELNKIKHLILE